MSEQTEPPASTKDDKRFRRSQKAAMRSMWLQPLAVTGILLAGAWIIVAVAAPWIAPYDPIAQASPRFLPPSSEHWFGTDGLGRDVFSRVLHGARISMSLALVLVSLSMTIGSVLGALAGFFGGIIDDVVMRLVDLTYAFPNIILAMAVVGALGPDLRNAVIALVVVSWPHYARVTRSLILSARDTEYVYASRLLGASTGRALAVDVAPNAVGPVLVLATLELGNAVLLLSALSFLGLGARPPSPEWGAMVSAGAAAFDRWWVGTFPGLAILSVVLAFNFLGDTLRDALDPRTARAVRG